MGDETGETRPAGETERRGVAMRFKDETFPAVTFDAFCETNGIEVSVYERAGETGVGRYYATDHKVEEMDRGCLVGAYGNGETKEAAVLAYAARLAGKRICIDATKSYRREVQCPNEWAKETP